MRKLVNRILKLDEHNYSLENLLKARMVGNLSLGGAALVCFSSVFSYYYEGTPLLANIAIYSFLLFLILIPSWMIRQ
ncbi:MAG: hypothetical protein AAFV07_08295, partial [Bacteroidota bacterium]